MKVSVLQENLNKGLVIVSRSITAKASLPILTNVLLATDKGQLHLATTNLEMGINYWLGAKIENEGAITIPAKFLTEIVSSLPPEKIDLEVKENTLFISSGVFKAEISGVAAKEFPQIPCETKEMILSFDKEVLGKALSQVGFAASQDEARPILTGILIRSEEGGVSLVATDGYRLSIRKIKMEGKIGEDFVIPAKTLVEVCRVAQEVGEKEEKIKVGFASGESQVVFSLPNVEIASRLIDGKFPDFEKIIPPSSETKVVFNRDEFLRSVKIAAIFAREQANILKLKVNKNGVAVSAESPQLGSNESQIDALVEGQDLEIAFNSRFLLDFLNAISDEEIVFEANGALNPGVFKSKKTEEDFLHIIMPVRIQG